VLDFEKHTATENYADTLPPEVKQAVAAKKAIEGMDRDQVLLAMGRPLRKSRESKDGVDYEDWIYGQPPGRVTFVTFSGPKVVKIKETYAGLGGSIAETPKQP
jgi:outer membrane protein assembly factor BamE (lipoprotein component of BamABCDE complex)